MFPNLKVNKQNQFKISDDRVKRETICNVVFLKKKYNYVMDCDKTHILSIFSRDNVLILNLP